MVVTRCLRSAGCRNHHHATSHLPAETHHRATVTVSSPTYPASRLDGKPSHIWRHSRRTEPVDRVASPSVAVCAADAPEIVTVIRRLSLRPRRDSSGKFYGVLLGCLVQQQSRDPPDHRPLFQELRDHLEEVHTACVVRSDVEEQAPGDEFTLEDVCGELEVAVRDSAVRPYRPNQLRVTMALDAMPNAVRLILSILWCPGVSLTLVLPLIPRSESGHADIPAWKLCELLNKEMSLVIDSLRHNFKIVFSPEEERPRTLLEYATAIRSGHSLDMPDQRLEELGVGDL